MIMAACPRCGNRVLAEAEAGNAVPLGYWCLCPRCNTEFAVPGGDGVPQPAAFPWSAIRADRVEPGRPAAAGPFGCWPSLR
ncbi:MAG TPA: hypothetical protein VH092_05820 [Urbifossiella sp.]|nr:hypothetical protein [Urbifossiella sp.]